MSDDIVKVLRDGRLEVSTLHKAADEIVRLRERLQIATETIDRQSKAEYERWLLIDRSPWDEAPCRLCGSPVLCVPDGLPFCNYCAEERDDE